VTKIADLLAAGPTYSFEFFPPKSDEELRTLARTLAELQPLSPSFVSVTYRGGAESRKRTHDLVSGMLHTTSLTPMAHLVCVAHSRLELAEILPPRGAPLPASWPTPSNWSASPAPSGAIRSAWPPNRSATRPPPT